MGQAAMGRVGERETEDWEKKDGGEELRYCRGGGLCATVALVV